MEDIFLYLCLAIGILSVIGETLSFLVYSRSKFSKSSFIIYFKSYSVVNIYGSIAAIRNFLQLKFQLDPRYSSKLLCKLVNYFNFSIQSMSPWILCIISLECLVKILFHKKYLFMKKNSL